MTWVSPSMAEEWGQTKEAIFAAAAANMRWLLADASITFLSFEDHKLGMLNTAYDVFKAALVLSPRLKDLAEPVLGWPLFVVMPCRDFVYLIPHKDQDVLGRVMEEYNESAYPLCTELFELTDAGLRAIGKFRRPQARLENP
jgi:hypothetical protein